MAATADDVAVEQVFAPATAVAPWVVDGSGLVGAGAPTTIVTMEEAFMAVAGIEPA